MLRLQEIIAKNLARVRADVEAYSPKIVAVSKYYSANHIKAAFECGLRDFGESRIPASIEKINNLDDELKRNSNYHFIGHLQTNKAKQAIGVFDLIHSVENSELVRVINKAAAQKGLVQKILIQVKNALDETKFGIAPSKLNDFLQEIQNLGNIEVVGLMNIAPLEANEKELRKLFSEMFKLKEAFGLKELSMGMSGDYKIALEEGATIIRLGRTLFE